MIKEKFFNELPFPSAFFTKNGIIISQNDKWGDLLNCTETYNLKEEPLFWEYDYQNILQRVFKGEIRLTTKPIFCPKLSSIFNEGLQGKYIIFNVFPYYENSDFLVCCIIEALSDPLESEFHNLSNEISNKNSLELIKMVEAERKRIARELHDEIIQKLLVAKLEIDLFQKTSEISSPHLEEIKTNILETTKDIRSLIQALHPVILEEKGIINSIELLAGKLNSLSTISVNFDVYGNYIVSDKNIELNIFRIVQEALNNVRKHSCAKKVDIQLHFNENVIIGSIHDNGKGINTSKNNENKGYGIISMKERVRSLNGDLSIESSKEKGTKIIFHIPVKNEIQ